MSQRVLILIDNYLAQDWIIDKWDPDRIIDYETALNNFYEEFYETHLDDDEFNVDVYERMAEDGYYVILSLDGKKEGFIQLSDKNPAISITEDNLLIRYIGYYETYNKDWKVILDNVNNRYWAPLSGWINNES